MSNRSTSGATRANDARALAVFAFDRAAADPAADWRPVAELLRACLPAARAPRAPSAAFADYRLPRVYQRDSVVFTFGDGVAVRCNVLTGAGKAPLILRAARVAVVFYRARTGAYSVPRIASAELAETGEAFDAAALTAATAGERAAPPVNAAPPPVTEASLARLSAELQRREHGLAQAVAREAAGMCQDEARREEGAGSTVWRAAVASLREEVEHAKAALARGNVPEARPEAPAWFVEAMARPLAPAEIEPASVAPPIALAPVLARPAPSIVVAEPEATARPIPVMAIAGADPVMGIAGETHFATEADAGAEITTGAPSPVSHPVIAVCASHRARGRLLAVVKDSLPTGEVDSKAGAFRLTEADAVAAAGTPSVRFIRRAMPRLAKRAGAGGVTPPAPSPDTRDSHSQAGKTPCHVDPVEAIANSAPTPVVEIRPPAVASAPRWERSPAEAIPTAPATCPTAPALVPREAIGARPRKLTPGGDLARLLRGSAAAWSGAASLTRLLPVRVPALRLAA